jgi:hypothetical protein
MVLNNIHLELRHLDVVDLFLLHNLLLSLLPSPLHNLLYSLLLNLLYNLLLNHPYSPLLNLLYSLLLNHPYSLQHRRLLLLSLSQQLLQFTPNKTLPEPIMESLALRSIKI